MKLYRAIEFSRLSFLIDEQHQDYWSAIAARNLSGADRFKNWWLKDRYEAERRGMVKNVINQNSIDFFIKSLDFNSKTGGRFNPKKSFGSIYASLSPTIGALEVLYHIFSSACPIYNTLKKSSDRVTNALNIPVPDSTELLIIVLEFQIDDAINCADLYSTTETIRDLCHSLGFSRYINSDFDENFVFGNDYEISNIIGCHLQAANKSIKVPSARIDVSAQRDMGIGNIVLSENVISDHMPSLEDRFKEYFITIDWRENSRGFPIKVNSIGSSSVEHLLYLEAPPTKKSKRIREFTQISDADKKYTRKVELQKFVL